MRVAPLILALLLPFAGGCSRAGEREDLISRYQKETSELGKRELALKMIDAGVIKRAETKVADIARIFGNDWQVAGVLDKNRSRGFVYFAPQASPPPDDAAIQWVPHGWYLMIDYLTLSGQVENWCVSNLYK
jgi:hypothetical protein